MNERSWTLVRAVLLVVAASLLSPISPVLLFFIPVALLLVSFRSGDWTSVAAGIVILVVAFADAGGRASDMAWVVPRGWSLLVGGAFVAVTARSMRQGPLGRGLAAVAIALLAVAGLGLLRPALLRELDWWVSGEIRHAAAMAHSLLASLPASKEAALREQFVEALYRWVAFQQQIYPALLALASLASLGVAWFALGRLSGVKSVLAPVREFRFADQLVWLLVVGLALLVLPLGAAAFRIGENAAMFMVMLYLVRGLAIMMWAGAAVVTSVWSGWALAVAGLLLYPVAVGTALVLGLSDTWLDLRGRMARSGLGRADRHEEGD